jgi:rhodanese-related sulfurtransferase
MKKYIIILLLAFTASMLISQQKGMHTVEVAEFQKFTALANKHLLDVRTPQEFTQGHIEGAVNLDYFSKDFKSELEKLDKSVPVYLYCRSGGRATKAMQIMKEIGFVTVYNLKGGFLAWSQKK